MRRGSAAVVRLIVAIVTGTVFARGLTVVPAAAAATNTRVDSRFVPRTYREADRVVLPFTLPDGNRAELTYPKDLDLASLGFTPGEDPGTAGPPLPPFGWPMISYSTVRQAYGKTRARATFPGVSGSVRLFPGGDARHHAAGLAFPAYLVFQFGHWLVEIGFRSADAQNADVRSEARVWARGIEGRVDRDGFLHLEGTLLVPGLASGSGRFGSPGTLSPTVVVTPDMCDATTPASLTDVRHYDSSPQNAQSSWCDRASGLRVDVSGPATFVDAAVRELRVRPAQSPPPRAPVIIAGKIAVAPDGSVYLAEAAANRIRRIAVDGTVSTAVGTGTQGQPVDGQPATEAELNLPDALVFDDTGTLYFTEQGSNAIRQVTPDGVIRTVADSTALGGRSCDTPRSECSPGGITISPTGELYATVGDRVVRVNRDNSVTAIAGNGLPGQSGDGGPALDAQLGGASTIAADGAGNLYVFTFNTKAMWKITPDGMAHIVEGFQYVTDLAQSPDGSVLVYARLGDLKRVWPDGASSSVRTPVGESGSVAASRDGSICMIEGTNGPSHLVRVDPGGSITPLRLHY